MIASNPIDVTFVAGFSIPLPLWNRNQGRIAEAEANLAKVADEGAAAETRAHADLNEAYQTLARAAEETRILRETVLPGAKSAVDQITEGYSTGRFSQLDVLDAQRSYNETRTQYVRALADYHKAQAQIDALTAGPVELPNPIEAAMAGIPGLENTRSLSYYGLSQVTAVFKEGTDVYLARQLIAERLRQAGD